MNPHDTTAAPNPDEHVDEEILSELFSLLDDGTTDGLSDVCDLFLLGAPTSLAEIEDALAGQRLDDVRRLAHTLRGTAGAFGALHLGHLAGRLEDVCRDSDPAPAGALVEAMQVEYETFRTILTSRLESSTAAQSS